MNNEDMSDVFSKLNNIAGNNNISPDIINNFMNMLNNSNNGNTSANDSNNIPFESNNSNANNTSEYSDSKDNSFNSNGIDFETIMKMKAIIDKMNTKDDPRSNLLQSLKPYLNDSRKAKVDQYIGLMNMSKVMDVFPFIGGEKKK